MDFAKAAHAFQEYLKDYDQNNDKVKLTYCANSI